MRILFVRHGETTFNAARRFQTKDVALSERGKIEAHLMARRIKDFFPAEALIASDMWRSQQTAEILGSVLGITAEYTDDLREVRRPSEIAGKRVWNPYAAWVHFVVATYGQTRNFRYSDEETINEARERAQMFLNRLIARPESHIVVVSHEMFTKTMFESMAIAPDARGMTAYRLFRPFLILRNASITECTWDGAWRINSINDTSHLRDEDLSFLPR